MREVFEIPYEDFIKHAFSVGCFDKDNND